MIDIIRHGSRSKRRYVLGLRGWTGYDKNELMEGKYRPAFQGRNKYGGENRYEHSEEYYKKKMPHMGNDFVLVPSSDENIKKIAEFNLKYSSTDSSKRLALKELKRLKR